MAKTDVSENVASLDPDEMMAGGLKDDFRGRVTDAVYCKWDYDGAIEDPVLAVRLTMDVDEEDDPFIQHWSAGDLAAFVPSQDGREEADEGPYAVRVGKRPQLNNNTNYAHLMASILDAGAASGKFGRENLTSSLDCLVGLYAHWNRVPQKKRAGLAREDAPAEGQRARSRDVLVVTEVIDYGEKKAAKAKPATKPLPPKRPAPKVEEAEVVEEETATEANADLDARIQEAVVEALGENGGKLKKSKIPTVVLKAMAKDKDKSRAVKRCMEDDFLEGGPWEFDSGTATLTL
jgi:hypothetical protein